MSKKQTKKGIEEQATVVKPNHKDMDFLKEAYVKQGMSAGQIAKACGVSRAAVLFQLKKAKIDVSKTRKTKSADAKEDYLNASWLTKQLKSGLTVFAIAKQQGVSFASVSRQAYKLIPAKELEAIREENRKKKAEAKKSKTTAKKTTPKKAVKKTAKK